VARTIARGGAARTVAREEEGEGEDGDRRCKEDEKGRGGGNAAKSQQIRGEISHGWRNFLGRRGRLTGQQRWGK
jgi:hypothetical protein